ncbi:hypothetical protein AAKU61_003794 [Undibacterium sp. GrIS 1.2]|uniref:DUF2491 family protein n=1 Tax=Undibacterium sp. GrIS 1.2 TaxID=3143933 RepID=UPI00199C1A2D|nr:DUF2491 family protein [Glaciimonas sp.]
MSWTDSIKYIKGIASKHGVDSLKQDSRSDDGLPLGAKIGGLITFQITPFVRASGAGSFVCTPTANDSIIRSIGHVNLDFPGNIYRYYMETGDDEPKKEKFLQVVIDETGTVIETMYCSSITRLIPESEDDQNAFTGEGGVGLGQLTYTLWKDQLLDCGFSESEMTLAFRDSDQLDYTREVGSGEYVKPFNGTEVRIDDAQGVHGIEEQIWFTPYVRSLADGNQEHLLITTSVVNSRDGDSSRRSIYVDFMVGIILEKERITIQ